MQENLSAVVAGDCAGISGQCPARRQSARGIVDAGDGDIIVAGRVEGEVRQSELCGTGKFDPTHAL